MQEANQEPNTIELEQEPLDTGATAGDEETTEAVQPQEQKPAEEPPAWARTILEKAEALDKRLSREQVLTPPQGYQQYRPNVPSDLNMLDNNEMFRLLEQREHALREQQRWQRSDARWREYSQGKEKWDETQGKIVDLVRAQGYDARLWDPEVLHQIVDFDNAVQTAAKAEVEHAVEERMKKQLEASKAVLPHPGSGTGLKNKPPAQGATLVEREQWAARQAYKDTYGREPDMESGE